MTSGALKQLGKYAIPTGTAALGGGALGYLAYKLSPEKYKKLMGTIGAVVGAAAGAYGGYRLSQGLYPIPAPVTSNNATKDEPSSVIAESSLYDKSEAREKTSKPAENIERQIERQRQEELKQDLDPRNPLGRILTLEVQPRWEGLKRYLAQPSPLAESGFKPVTSPHWWYFKAVDKALDPAVDAIGNGSLIQRELGRAARPVGYSIAGTVAEGAIKLGNKLLPEKITGSFNALKPLSTIGTATDRVTMALNTIGNVKRGLADGYVEAKSQAVADEIAHNLGENAKPVDTLRYAFNRQLMEKGLQTTAAGASIYGTGGFTSALGVNNGLPLEEIAAVGKEVSRHYKPGQTSKEVEENREMLANLGNLVLHDSHAVGWAKALSMGYGMDKVEKRRIDTENRIWGRKVNVPATQRNIARITNEVKIANPELAKNLSSSDFGIKQAAQRILNRLVAARVQRTSPVYLTQREVEQQ